MILENEREKELRKMSGEEMAMYLGQCATDDDGQMMLDALIATYGEDRNFFSLTDEEFSDLMEQIF